jgi:hypothetical protein
MVMRRPSDDRADRVQLLVRLEVEQAVGDRPPHAGHLVGLAGVGEDGVLEGRLDGLRHLGVGDGDEVVVQREWTSTEEVRLRWCRHWPGRSGQ